MRINKNAAVKAAFMALPFLLMDLITRWNGRNIAYFRGEMVAGAILFDVAWIILFVGIAMQLPEKGARIFYGAVFWVNFVLFVAQGVYLQLTDFYFSCNLLLMAGEGAGYVLDTLLHADLFFYIVCLIVLLCSRFWILYEKRHSDAKPQSDTKQRAKKIAATVITFAVLRILAPVTMGPAHSSELEWDSWRNPRDVYENFTDANKCMKICGLYEYSLKDFYSTFLKPKEKADPQELAVLEACYKNETPHQSNEMSGIYKDKNVIFLQLEGIDSWLLTEETMPNTWQLLKESLVFDRHFSYYNGGGSTFNSEFAVNTGFLTPIGYVRNAYTFNSNSFPHTLVNTFRTDGYSANAFHMNTGEYYSRRINYKNWGYENYYGLADEEAYVDHRHELDRELIENETFYDRMFHGDGKFLHYLITYTPHTPFTTTKKHGKLVAQNLLGTEVDYSEEESAKLFASETDYMVSLLIQALKDNGLYDNTVIVAYADHYLYTLNDKSILEKNKDCTGNLINQTPFFIWSAGQKEQHIEKVNSQIDILPTVLNLFGYEFQNEYYIGRDIFDADYTGYVFFSDRSWYDGSVYVENAEIVNDGRIDPDALSEMTSKLDALIERNDLTLKYDYWKDK